MLKDKKILEVQRKDEMGDDLKRRCETWMCDRHGWYLEIPLCLLLLCSQLWEWVLQRLWLGRVKLPLLFQGSGPLLVLLHPGVWQKEDHHPHPCTTQRGRGSMPWWGTFNYLATLSKEALKGALSAFCFNDTGLAGEVVSSWTVGSILKLPSKRSTSTKYF